jgi:hypothetical protein
MRKLMAGAAALALLAAGLGPVHPAQAKPGNNSWLKLEAELTADPTLVLPAEALPEGKARSEAKTHRGGLQLNRFRGKAEIPIVAGGLIPDILSATTAIVVMQLTRPPALTPYVECTLGLHEIEFEDDGTIQAEFEVDARLVPRHLGPTVKSKHGSCVVPGTTDPVVPDVLVGDLVNVSFTAAPGGTPVPILTGDFQAH